MILTADSIERFLKSLDANGHPHNTVRAYRNDLLKLMAVTGELATVGEFNEMAAAALTAWRREGEAPKTTGRRLGTYKSYGNFLDVKVLTKYNPPTPADPDPHPLPEGRAGVLVMAHGADTASGRALVALCGLAGTRCHEARAVAPGDITGPPGGRSLYVRGKGDKYRRVPLADDAWAFCAPALEWAERERSRTIVGLADRTSRELITKLGEGCLGHHVSSHDLRMTFATHVYGASNHNLRLVQKLLGHASITTTQLYLGVNDDEARGAVAG